MVALYRAADVMLVTPIRDGMNLVAKEFVASRTDRDGVLVLSEFTGAASELAEALHVNPFDISGTADVFAQALDMPEDERRFRMRALQRRVISYDVERWARAFLEGLERTPRIEDEGIGTQTSSAAVLRLVRCLRRASDLILLLDFDGTLVPFAPSPELAKPDPSLLRLLGGLAARPHTEVHVVSGRARETIQRWLGWLPIGLHVEHGTWSRLAGDAEWTCAEPPDLEWRPRVISILEDWASRTPGSFVEEKTACVAWHYRAADPEFGAHQARELHVHLRELLSNLPVEILSGEKIIEVRPYGAHKGRVVVRLLESAPRGATLAAFGDDVTDEDLFAALPPDGYAIHVGSGDSRASYRVAGVAEVRALLADLLKPDEGADRGGAAALGSGPDE